MSGGAYGGGPWCQRHGTRCKWYVARRSRWHVAWLDGQQPVARPAIWAIRRIRFWRGIRSPAEQGIWAAAWPGKEWRAVGWLATAIRSSVATAMALATETISIARRIYGNNGNLAGFNRGLGYGG